MAISLKTVYNNLDPNIMQFAERPVGYEADATRIARRRAALAGYRLADELRRLFRVLPVGLPESFWRIW